MNKIKHLLTTLVMLLCTTLLSAQAIKSSAWDEIDNLFEKGHYSSAYKKSEQLLNKAKLTNDGHSILKAAYKLCIAADCYQEETFKSSIETYQSIIPLLQGEDKSIAYLLLGNTLNEYYDANRHIAASGHPLPTIKTLHTITYEEISTDWTKDCFTHAKHLCDKAALAESEALKATRTEDYDLLLMGDAMSLRLRPTLYDVVMHAIIDNLSLPYKLLDSLSNDQLFGDAKDFLSLNLPQNEAESISIWQLSKVQEYTRYHQNTPDAAVRAHIDLRRVEKLNRLHYSTSDYTKSLERLAQSYTDYPAEEAMFLYYLAERYTPHLYPHSSKQTIEEELQRAAKAERYIARIRAIAPKTEWAKLGEALLRNAALPSISLQSQQTLIPGQTSNISLTVRNAGNLTYYIVPRHAGETPRGCNQNDLLRRTKVKTEKVNYSHNNPYQYHEIKLQLPTLNAGEYFLLVTNNGKDKSTQCIATTALSVTNLKLSILRNSHERHYIGMAIDATTGRAVTPSEVALMEISDKETRLVKTFTPNKRGYFTIPFPTYTSTHRDLFIRVTDGVSQAFYTINYYDRRMPTSDTHKEDIEETHITFFPDRYTYRPGDQVQFSLIAYGHSTKGSRVINQLPINITLLSSRDEKIATLNGTTDKWGCYNGSFTIPADATPGRFMLQAEAPEDITNHQWINIESFKAPAFKVAIEKPDTIITLGDHITLKGTAIAYSGVPITGAKVRFEVSAYDIAHFDTDSRHATPPGEVIDSTATKAKGLFHIPIKTHKPYDSKQTATYRYTVTAHVTDSNGETHSASTSFLVGSRTKQVEINTPSLITHGDSIEYSLLTLNDTRLAEKISVRLSRLRAPYSALLDHTSTSDYGQWEEERLLTLHDEHTATNRASYLHLTDEMPGGTYRLTITYTDGGESYTETQHFELWDEGKSTVSSNTLYLSHKESLDIQTGDTAVIYIGTRHDDVNIHYYICADNHTTEMGTITLSDETSTLRIPIRKEWHDRMVVYLVSVKNNVERITWETFFITNQTEQLNVHLSTLRNTLEPGETEQCTISVSDADGHPVRAALTLSVYDTALDKYGKNIWKITPNPALRIGWDTSITIEKQELYASNHNPSFSMPSATAINHYRLPFNSWDRYYDILLASAPRKKESNENITLMSCDVSASKESGPETDPEASGFEESQIHLRQNLNHTALFLPTLRTDEQGQATFTLTAPDLFSEWHVKGIAHTEDVKYGELEHRFVTRKMLMVQPNVPRFLYEGDSCYFTAKVTNNDNKRVEAKVKLSINDTHYTKTIVVNGESSTALSFPFTVPDGTTSLTYRITAHTESRSDGELGKIVILPRRSLITETMALYTNGSEKREFVFETLKNNRSNTLEHKSLRLDVVSNPIWYAIEALPTLAKEENPSNERLFHRYYAVAMSQYLIDHAPEVEAHGDFFCRDSLSLLQHDLLSRLHQAQSSDGGWAWMEGFESDLYTTLLIIKGLGELKTMGCISITKKDSLYTMMTRGVHYLDSTYQREFKAMEKKPKRLYSHQLYYLYTRSLFPEVPFDHAHGTAYKHYTKLLSKEKATHGTLTQKALRMLTLIRLNKPKKAKEIAKVVNESALSSDEMGIYWRDNTHGWGWSWGWDSNATATQALLIEAFVQLQQPADIIARMQQWLLKQKQSTRWNSSVTTAQAIHALIIATPHSFIEESNMDVRVGDKRIRHTPSGKLGLIQHTWTAKEILPSLAKVSLEKETNSPSWGAMTWQYYENADKVEATGTGLSLGIKYYKVEQISDGERLIPISDATQLTKGDHVRIQVHFTADRDIEYVELSLQRPASLEPRSTRSGYAYNDGVCYYQSIENTRNVYYIYRLSKGRYLINCDLWVNQSGDYSCGVSTIQCMYAPEFVATAKSQRLSVAE